MHPSRPAHVEGGETEKRSATKRQAPAHDRRGRYTYTNELRSGVVSFVLIKPKLYIQLLAGRRYPAGSPPELSRQSWYHLGASELLLMNDLPSSPRIKTMGGLVGARSLSLILHLPYCAPVSEPVVRRKEPPM